MSSLGSLTHLWPSQLYCVAYCKSYFDLQLKTLYNTVICKSFLNAFIVVQPGIMIMREGVSEP